MKTYTIPNRYPYIYTVLLVLIGVLMIARVSKAILILVIVVAVLITLFLLYKSAQKIVITHEYIMLTHFKKMEQIALNNIKGYRLIDQQLLIYPVKRDEIDVLEISSAFLKHNPELVQWIKTNMANLAPKHT